MFENLKEGNKFARDIPEIVKKLENAAAVQLGQYGPYFPSKTGTEELLLEMV